ncbi:MAG TPA: trehalose-phosphatase [Chloroflexi bacterium]|nr:trehalose-phosphatase [Chloroflexota bacterium]
MNHPLAEIEARLRQAERLRLFLDYDGTLADLAPTPDHVEPDPAVVTLIERLARASSIRVAIISGRRLAHVERLVPVDGILLAGTYGVELRMPTGQRVERVAYGAIRPHLERIKPRWERLIEGREGFFLEDKDWSLALHARYAGDDEAGETLDAARNVLEAFSLPPGTFRVLGGHKFLEVGPKLAHKGKTVAYLLDRDPLLGAVALYLGDDDKDEEAFGVVQDRGGWAILVSDSDRSTSADARLGSPQAVRRCLGGLLSSFSSPELSPLPIRHS